MIDFDAIKAAHPLEKVFQQRYQVTLRRAGSNAWECLCPIHNEKTPSCRINTAKQVWHCHGCKAGGSVLDLVMLIEGAKDAKVAAEILEGRELGKDNRVVIQKREPITTERTLPSLPRLFRGQGRHFDQVAKLRKLDPAAIAFADHYGTLGFCLAYDQPSYAICDMASPANCQVRRLDGEKWFGRSKVMGITGNWAAWPVGLMNMQGVHGMPISAPVLLVEGTGDLLAAWQVVLDRGDYIAPVAMFGAGQNIHPGALPCFEGRHITIIEQHDAAGAVASYRWADQIAAARAASVRIWQVPTPGADLNDFVSAGGDINLIFA